MDIETTGGASPAPKPARKVPSGSPLDWGIPGPRIPADDARWAARLAKMVELSKSDNPPDPATLSDGDRIVWDEAVGKPRAAAEQAAKRAARLAERAAMTPEQKKADDQAQRRARAAAIAAEIKENQARDLAEKAAKAAGDQEWLEKRQLSAPISATQMGFPEPGFMGAEAGAAPARTPLPSAQPLRDPKAESNRLANEKLVDAVMAAPPAPPPTPAMRTGPMSDAEMVDYWRRVRQQEAAAAQGENTIEPVLVREATPDEQRLQGERDAKRLHEVVDTAHIVMSAPAGDLTRDEASNMATDDIVSIRAIKDQRIRQLALLAAAESRHAQPHYKAEFDRQAPALAIEAEEAVARKRGLTPAAVVPAMAAAVPAAAAAVAQLPPAAAPATPVDKSAAIPEAVARRFLKGDNARYHFPDRSPAFVDRGNKLATHGENIEVIGALVAIAKARGWEHVKVGGTEAFRRAAWIEASQVGVKVDGYTPTTLDLEELARRPMGNTVAPAAERMQAPAPGEAPKLTLVKPAEAAPAAPAAAAAAPRDPDRLAKAASFANDKPTFVVKKYPDLAPAFGTLSAAAVFAAEHFPGHEQRFVEIARQALSGMIADGKQVPGPLLVQQPDKVKGPERGRSAPKEEVQQRTR